MTLTTHRMGPGPPRRLIVNADDLGLSRAVNAGIIAAHRHGIVTSTTLLANGAAFDHPVAPAAPPAGPGLGVPPRLVRVRPPRPPPPLRSLVDAAGQFVGGTPALALRAFLGRLVYAELVRELRAQIARVVDAGVRPTHVDTHQHSHCLPIVCAAALEAAASFGITRIRFPRERNLGALTRHLRSRARSALTAGLAVRGRRWLVRHAAHTTDSFIGPQLMGALAPATLVQVIATLPPGTTELMCHPGLASEPGALIQRRGELAALTSPAVWHAPAAAGVEPPSLPTPA